MIFPRSAAKSSSHPIRARSKRSTGTADTSSCSLTSGVQRLLSVRGSWCDSGVARQPSCPAGSDRVSCAVVPTPRSIPETIRQLAANKHMHQLRVRLTPSR